MTLISDDILQDTVLSLGLAIAFYYAITGFACVWYFRSTLFTSWRNFWYRLAFPLVDAVLLTGAFIYSAIDMLDPDNGYTVLFGVGGVFVVGVGSLLLGAVLMVVWSFFAEAKPFFHGQSLNRDTRRCWSPMRTSRSHVDRRRRMSDERGVRATAASERRTARTVRIRAPGRLEGC